MDFKKISFGYASAEKERAHEPILLKEGYFDLNGASDKALNGQEFLFLGYKGSGKSAIGERIELLEGDKYSSFVKRIQLADFPFSLFSKIVRGNSEPEVKYPTAWAWILLIYLIESFDKDNSATHENKSVLTDILKSLGKMGLCPVTDAASIVRVSSKTSFNLSIPNVLETKFESGGPRPASEIPMFVNSLKEIVCKIKTTNRHYIVIDGLDDILTKNEVQYTSIGSLIFEVDRLNNMFAYNETDAKIILLCRTDIFERVSGANKNKIRQDSAVEIDWYHDTKHPENSSLLSIANLRATLSLGCSVDIFDTFITNKIHHTDPRVSLLDMTRHTPRDFLQLLKSIQNFSKNNNKVTTDQVLNGMRQYSITYFLPEIRDELVGYASSEEADYIFDIFSTLKKRDFTYQELLSIAEQTTPCLTEERIGSILKAMFECSAIGNIQHRSSGTTYYTFKYRNRQSVFKKNEGIMLHKGLWKALNLV